MKYILHIDTATDTAVVALNREGTCIAYLQTEENRNHAANLNNMIQTLVADEHIALGDLAAVCLCSGPGSYTGLRIGLSTVKGLCYALDIPMLSHNRLLLLALPYIYNKKSKNGVYTVILPARQKEYFIASYNETFEIIISPQHIHEANLSDMVDDMKKNSFVICNEAIGDTLMNIGWHISCFIANSVALNHWSLYTYAQYNCNGFVNLEYAEPEYLKQAYTT